MNTFEDWTTQPGEDEVVALNQRAKQIRTLCDETHLKAKENNEPSQEKNRKLQDSRVKKGLRVESFAVGSKVYVRTGGLKSNLQPRSVAPYTIEGVGTNHSL